ncbi:MAG TPA: orotidine 5'-phosphate decarboxylase, partial [Methanoregulaceae archaeon]|nr:orotidine 5'-phosphate decarboxylase [Methanoregulaceae archaeon]
MTQLILALDVSGRTEALRIGRQCAPHIDAIKVGYPLVLSAGLSIARDLAATGLPL